MATAHADSVLEGKLASCASRPDDTARLACFDALAESIARSDPPHRGAGDSPPDDAATAETKSEPKETEAAPEPSRWRGRVDRIERQPRGEQVFFLVNDQIWVELEPGRFRYQAGAEVIIERTTSRGYVLFTDAGRATRVRRIE